MGLAPDTIYIASDVDRRPLATVAEFLELVGQPHRIDVRDLVADPPTDAADVALLLKLVTTLDRQDPEAAARLLRGLRARHAVVSLPGALAGWPRQGDGANVSRSAGAAGGRRGPRPSGRGGIGPERARLRA